MSYFRIVGEGAQVSEPLEAIVESATAARAKQGEFQRLCGPHGKITVWGKDGRVIRSERLDRMMREEGT